MDVGVQEYTRPRTLSVGGLINWLGHELSLTKTTDQGNARNDETVWTLVRTNLPI